MIGRTILHYKITEKLGEGGMGVVYKAEDTKFDRPVDLKFLAPHLVSDEDVCKRFEREAKAAAALNHPNICHVYSIDEIEGKSTIMPAVSSQSVGARHAVPARSAMQLSEHPLVKYRVIEDGQEAGDAIRYVAEDTELHRSVAIRVLSQSLEQQIERAQRRKQNMLLGVGVVGVLLALISTFILLFSPSPITETPVRRFSFSPEGLIGSAKCSVGAATGQ